jgi:hypothetical protein
MNKASEEVAETAGNLTQMTGEIVNEISKFNL